MASKWRKHTKTFANFSPEWTACRTFYVRLESDMSTPGVVLSMEAQFSTVNSTLWQEIRRDLNALLQRPAPCGCVKDYPVCSYGDTLALEVKNTISSGGNWRRALGLYYRHIGED